MSEADVQYKQIINKIISDGYSNQGEQVRTVWKDGEPAYTKSIVAQSMHFSNNEVPILTTKKVAWKTAIRELLWIWQKKSNNVEELRQMNVQIWNEWEQEDGTIGKAYGYQLGKRNRTYPVKNLDAALLDPSHQVITGDTILIDQVDYLIQELKSNPSSRRHITMLWNPDELDEMSLTPCVYETQWHVKGNRLHLEVRCRSNDMGLGNPFNVFQYNVLQRMIAQVTGYELGEYHFHIGDAHIYERHTEPLQQQVSRKEFQAPELVINPEVTSFYDFTIDDFQLLHYQFGDKVQMEIAI